MYYQRSIIVLRFIDFAQIVCWWMKFSTSACGGMCKYMGHFLTLIVLLITKKMKRVVCWIPVFRYQLRRVFWMIIMFYPVDKLTINHTRNSTNAIDRCSRHICTISNTAASNYMIKEFKRKSLTRTVRWEVTELRSKVRI